MPGWSCVWVHIRPWLLHLLSLSSFVFYLKSGLYACGYSSSLSAGLLYKEPLATTQSPKNHLIPSENSVVSKSRTSYQCYLFKARDVNTSLVGTCQDTQHIQSIATLPNSSCQHRHLVTAFNV